MHIVMPKLGLTMTEATLTRWLKGEGETVQAGETMFEFESDKATMEYEAPSDGVLVKRMVAEGTTVACGTPVAEYETAASTRRSRAPEGAQTAEASGVKATQAVAVRAANGDRVYATPAAKRRARELGLSLSGLTGRGPQGRVQLADVEELARQEEAAEPAVAATPVARRMARDLGLDVQTLAGSGREGRVTRDDVLRAARKVLKGAELTTTGASIKPAIAGQAEPLSGVRAVIARRMSESAFTAPHVTLHTEADASALVAAREQLNLELAGEGKISFNTLFIAIVARALRQHPALNACLVDEVIHYYDEINVALAVDSERGLLAPVVRHADRLDLAGIEAESEALIARALEGNSLPDDLSGGTFTISNLGAFGVDAFTPIINQPQAAILGIGRIVSRPANVQGRVALREMVTLSLSFDHRIVDGGPAARFLQRISQLVERPFGLMLGNS